MTSTHSQTEPPAVAYFVTTRWSVVISAQDKASPEAGEALEALCRNYWSPLYSYVRRQGHSAHDAQDLTQDFFAHMLRKNSLVAADPSKGKFRSFLLASLKNFLANEWDKAQAQKRGGGKTVIPIDPQIAENSWALDPSCSESADKLFERRWAMTLLERTMARLQAEYVSDGKHSLFESLKETLAGERSSIPYVRIAECLKTSEGAVKVAVHRLRQRYRELLRAEIADTVATRQEIEEELRHLFAALKN